MRPYPRLASVAFLLLLAVLLVPAGGSPLLLAQANTGGCSGQASTNSFGTVYWGTDCTVTSTQTWGNGTLTIAGSLSISPGATLTLWNMDVKFASTGDLQRNLGIGGGLVMEYGTLQSNDAYHWYMTSSSGLATVKIEHANIAGAGSGSTFGIVVSGNGGNRFAYDTISGVNMQVVGSHGDYVGYSNISNYDDSVLNQHVVWMGANSTFEHNTMWNITLGSQSAVTNYRSYGNVDFFANTLYLRSNGNNAMGFEVINDQAAQVNPLYPGKWVARLTWNNMTWYYTAGGSNSHPFDNEFSERIHIANNTVTMSPGTVGTECLQAGGMTDSLVEHNTCYGRFEWCIYEYIYNPANNLFQANRCDNADYGGIFQTGGNVYRDNAFTHLTSAGIWICPNTTCAGSGANTSNNAWYNNTFTFASSTPYLTKMNPSNAFYNVFVGHGANAWTDGTNSHPVYGDWLFFANAPIQHLVFADQSDGHRTLTFTSGGQSYWDEELLSGVSDNGAVAVDGAIDLHGSVYGGTVLRSLDPKNATRLVVTGTGATTFTFRGYAPNYTYNVSLQNLGTGAFRNGTLAMNGSGYGQFLVDFGSGMVQYGITVWGSVPAPPGDTTPPGQVADLRALALGSRYVVLAWTAPGNNGSVGRAAQYDLRYGTSGPLNNSNFAQATQVATPPPRLSGSTESLNLTGLQPGTRYWIGLRTADAVPNWSPISNILNVSTASLPRPIVQAASVNATASTVDIVFSQPMNRSSVNATLYISGQVPFHITWLDDRHIRVVFDRALEAGASYTLTLSSNATDQDGVALGSSFAYTFAVSPIPQPRPPLPPSSDPSFVIILAAGLVIFFAVSHVYGRRMYSGLRTGAQRFTRRIRGRRNKSRRPPETRETKRPPG